MDECLLIESRSSRGLAMLRDGVLPWVAAVVPLLRAVVGNPREVANET